MTLPLSLGDLARPEWDQFQAALDRFETAWNGSASVDLSQFLPPRGDRLRLVYLFELVKTELEILWRRGQRPLIEEYLKRFPELKERPSELPKLLAEEYRARESGGDHPPFADYQQRFPEHFAEFCRLVGTANNHSEWSDTLKPGARPRSAPPPAPPPPPPPPLAATARPPATTVPASSAPPESSALSSGLLPVGGGYKLVRRLGAGQFGEVWLAEAPGGVEVAVKIIRRGLDQAEAQRELQALEATKRLRHTFLLQLQAYWSLEDRLIIAMELADGSLADELKKYGGRGMPLANLLRYVEETAEVLDFIHDQKVMHRDVKPDNILLMRGHVKLADLGLARLMMERSFTGTSCGSPAYMAPEVWQGRAARHSDQYSLAATYVQLRLDRSLFPGADMYAIMMAHVREVPEMKELPAAERQVLLKALAKQPDQRYPTCMAFINALRRAVDETTVRRPPARKPQRPRWALWAAGVIALLTISLAAATIWLPGLFSHAGPEPTRPLTTGHDSTDKVATEKEQPPTGPWLPAGYEPGDGAIEEQVEGKSYFSHIVYKGLAVPRDHATFILVKPPAGSDLKAPFYLMQHKVSNRFFRAVLDAHRNKLPVGWPRPDWEKGAKSVDGKVDLPIAGPAPEGGDYADFPVFRVRADDAEQFARLIGGHLPLADEWGIAAGYSPQDEDGGPFQGQAKKWELGDFALRKTAPLRGGAMPIGTAKRDHRCVEAVGENCVKSCYDMASNGFEWTATAVDETDRVIGRVPFAEDTDVYIRLMGANYRGLSPLMYTQMTTPDKEWRRSEVSEMRLAEISFRVLIRIDSPR